MGPGPHEFCSIGTLLVPLLKQQADSEVKAPIAASTPLPFRQPSKELLTHLWTLARYLVLV
jgi:hypothetical protein